MAVAETGLGETDILDADQEQIVLSPGKRPKHRIFTVNRLLAFGAICAVLGIWQGLIELNILHRYVLSAPSSIFADFGPAITKDDLIGQAGVSAYQFIVGYSCAVVAGISIGLALGWFTRLAAAFQPIVGAMYATPRIALIPLFVVWLGVGNTSKFFIVFIEGTFQILFSTSAGVRATDDALLAVAQSFCADRRQVFRTVIIPSSVPFIISGMRLAIGTCIIGDVVSELLAGTAGLGYMIGNAGNTFNIPLIFVGVIVLAAASIMLMSLLSRVERHFQSWRPKR